MLSSLKRRVAPLAIIVGLLVPAAALPVAANSNLCVTHYSIQPGPSGYAGHTVGNFISGTEYKIVQYFKAGPGYLYLADTRRRFCG